MLDRDRIVRIVPLLLAVCLMSGLVVLLLTFGSIAPEKSIVHKEELKAQIVKALQNGGDLRALRNVFENRLIVAPGLRFLFSEAEQQYYRADVPLSKVLEDIRSDVYIGKQDLKMVLEPLNRIVLEHNERNPFDSLEPSQRDYFENVRLKAGVGYGAIKNEIDRIAGELEAKNALVAKYLNQATTSFWLSIIGLAFSLLIGTVQIFHGRTSRLTALMTSVLSKGNRFPKEDKSAQ